MITRLKLKNWRNYEDLDIGFTDGPNVFVGGNAQGKTNLLEAIFYASFFDSFKKNIHQEDLVRFGAPGFFAEFHLADKVVSVKVSKNHQGLRKEIFLNKKKISPAKAFGLLPLVLFAPSDVDLLVDPAGARRGYLDGVLSLVDQRYEYCLSCYKKIIRQRNTLLYLIAKGVRRREELFFWNNELAKHGTYIIAKRLDFVSFLNASLGDLYAYIGQGGPLQAVYESPVVFDRESLTTNLAELLTTKEDTEIRRGETTVGPHRDDLLIYLGTKDLSKAGSRGEQRSAVLALKFLEADYLEEKRGVKPIFLLDDVLSELDVDRRGKLLDFIKQHQSFITATDKDLFAKDVKCHLVSQGKIS